MCEPLSIATIGAAVLSTATTAVMAVNQSNAAGDAKAEQKKQSEQAIALQKQQQAASLKDPNLQLTAQKNRDAIARMRMGTPSTIAAASGGGGMGSPPPVTGGIEMPANPQMMTAMALKQRTGQ